MNASPRHKLDKIGMERYCRDESETQVAFTFTFTMWTFDTYKNNLVSLNILALSLFLTY